MGQLSQTVYRLDPTAVCTEQVLENKFLTLTRSAGQRLFLGGKEMEATDRGVDRCYLNLCTGVIENVDNARVTASGHGHRPLGRIDDERLILRQIIFGNAAASQADAARTDPIALWIVTRYGSR